jgi:hypothetical protein
MKFFMMIPIFYRIWLVVLFFPLLTLAQQSPVILSEEPSSNDTSSAINPTPRLKTGFTAKKISSGVQFGSSFTSFGNYGSAFSTSISPYLSYPISKRFSVSGGITFTNTSMFGIKPFYASTETTSMNGNFTSALLYVSGDYLVNDRLRISGTLYKEINLYNSVPTNFPYSKPEVQGGYMKVDYKVFENFHIEAGFGFSQGGSPYNSYQSVFPYQNTGFPYSSSPFNR